MPEVNYVPDPRSPVVLPTIYYSDTTVAGHGSPEGSVVAWPGATYVDVDSGDRYTKVTGNGTADGWTIDSSGGGAGGTYEGSGSPEGSQTGDPGNTYWDSANDVFYVKDTGTGTNTGWRELIA